MKSIVLSAIAVLGSGVCAAQEVGRVLSSTPVVQQVQVPRQVCTQETWQVPAHRSGAGAAIGALAGGAIGNSLGHGGGRAAATAIGIIGGAVLGDNIEYSGANQGQAVQRCSTQTMLESRVVAFQVVYEFAGKQYAVQMPQDPGPQVQLQVTPVGVAQPGPTANAQIYSAPVYSAPVYSAPVYAAPVLAPVVITQPVYITSGTQWYPSYYRYPYRPRVGVDLHYSHSWRHHDHWR